LSTLESALIPLSQLAWPAGWLAAGVSALIPLSPLALGPWAMEQPHL